MSESAPGRGRQTVPERGRQFAQHLEVQLRPVLEAHSQGIHDPGPDRGPLDDGGDQTPLEMGLV